MYHSCYSFLLLRFNLLVLASKENTEREINMSNQKEPVVPDKYAFLPTELFKEVQKNANLNRAATDAQMALLQHKSMLTTLAFQYALDNGILRSAEWEKSCRNTIRTEDESVCKFFSCPLFHGEVIRGKALCSPEYTYLDLTSSGGIRCIELSFTSSDMLNKYVKEWGLNCGRHVEQQRLNELRDRREELDAEIQKLEVLIRETSVCG